MRKLKYISPKLLLLIGVLVMVWLVGVLALMFSFGVLEDLMEHYDLSDILLSGVIVVMALFIVTRKT